MVLKRCYLAALLALAFAFGGCAAETPGVSAAEPTSPSETTASTELSSAPETQPTAHYHAYEMTVVLPGCTQGGYTRYFCACGEETVADPVPAKGHAWSDWVAVEVPTEQEEGFRQRQCAACLEVETQAVEKLPHTHNYSVAYTEATCTKAGCAAYTCRCGHSYSEEISGALGHAYGSYSSNHDATCLSDGTQSAICSRCGKVTTQTEAGTAYGHDWRDWHITQEAAEAKPGQKVRACGHCGVTESETIPALPHTHNYSDAVIAPTCTEDGYTEYRCVCGDHYREAATAAYGHSWSDWVVTKEPTEKKAGKKVRTCGRCGLEETETIDPLGHTHAYSEKVTEPTCLEDGFTKFTCACGDSYTGDETAALGHSWSQWETVTEPTYYDAGLRQRKCSRCKEKETETLPKLPIPEDTADLQILSYPETVHRNETVSLTICGTPGAEYDIDVYYASGESEAKGLENQTADENGLVTWSWKIGGKTAAGTYRIVISGDGESETVYFTVLAE